MILYKDVPHTCQAAMTILWVRVLFVARVEVAKGTLESEECIGEKKHWHQARREINQIHAWSQ